MKDIIRHTALSIAIAGAIAAACFSSSRNTPLPASAIQDEISWTAFCAARGYDPRSTSEEIVNEYLNTWIGSAAEEKALAPHTKES